MDMPTSKPQPKRTRPHQFIVRMSSQEYERYQQKLKKSNMTANSFNVKCLINKPIIQNTIEEVTIMENLQKQLSGIGNNINQIARIANADGHTPSIRVLEELKVEVSEIWRLLRRQKEAKH